MDLNRRLLKEFTRLVENPVPGTKVVFDDDNVRYLHVYINGPEESSYEGGVFETEMFFPISYPIRPPKMRFITKIYQ